MTTLSQLPDKIMETEAPGNATAAEILLWDALSQIIINHSDEMTSLFAFHVMERYLVLKKMDENDPS